MPTRKTKKDVEAAAPTDIETPELTKRFSYHKPTEAQTKTYTEMRNMALNFAQYIVTNTPASREQSLALTKLEESIMWANAAIARRS